MTVTIKTVDCKEAMELSKQFYTNDVQKKATEFCVLMSDVIWVGLIDDRLACIWGLMPPTLLSRQAYLWLNATELIKERQFVFVRHSQREVERMLEVHPEIVGHALVGNDRSIRWLKWLGAKFADPVGMGIPFRITKHG